MVRKRIVALSERIECLLRRKCGALSSKGRVIVVLAMLSLFTVLSLYFLSLIHISEPTRPY